MDRTGILGKVDRISTTTRYLSTPFLRPHAEIRGYSTSLYNTTAADMFSGSPFGNNRRPTVPTGQTTAAYNPATTHPASLRPPSSIPSAFSQQGRIHATMAGGNGCDRERAWVDQWQAMKEHAHPASLTPGRLVGTGEAKGSGAGEQQRSKL